MKKQLKRLFNWLRTRKIRVLDIVFAISLFISYMIFVLCGFEHCVANAFYLTYGSVLNSISPIKLSMFFIANILGNITGGRIMKEVSMCINERHV